MRPQLIAVDWGTTSFRAYLTDSRGAVIERHESARGILSVVEGRFASVLSDAIRAWRSTHGDLPVLLSGMIGSRQGWREAPYARCPAGLAEIARQLMTFEVDGVGRVAIVPGLDTRSGAGIPDVMRGEETQIFGALHLLGTRDGTFVLPGTHSKWVTVVDGAIASFATYMTGEVFAALKDHTILGRLMEAGIPAGTGFRRGVEAASRAEGSPGALLNHIFSARTLGLMADVPGADLADYLSGLLIGSEIKAAASAGHAVTIIAADTLSGRYGTACGQLGLASRQAPPDCAAAGLAAVARAAGLIGGNS